MSNLAPVVHNQIIVHDSTSLKLEKGSSPDFGTKSNQFEEVLQSVKCVTSTTDGRRIAFITSGEVRVFERIENGWKRIGTLRHGRAQEVCFSPKGSFVAVWETFIQSEGTNLSVYDVMGRKLLKAFVQKSQVNWQPQWTADEAVFARFVPSEIQFYKSQDLDRWLTTKKAPKMKSFSLSPSSGDTHYVIIFLPSDKGAPASIQLHQFSSTLESEASPRTPLATKSFYKVDSVECHWGHAGIGGRVLVLTTSESDQSYYGQQMLFYLDASGRSNSLTFPKSGTIRSVCWCPSGREYVVVYGQSPSNATIFNLKGDPVSEFGVGARNLALINPQGNLLLLGAMGNISSRFEIWDVETKKRLGQQECSDITYMEWSPCGKFILTATCSPRLRVNNGYKVWHYTGTLQHENMYQGSPPGELYVAKWLPNPLLAVPFKASSQAVPGIQTCVKKASNERYVPPSQRRGVVGLPETDKEINTNKKFLSEMENASQSLGQDPKQISKSAKRKKKMEEAKKKREEEKGMDKDWREAKEEKEEDVKMAEGTKVQKKKKNNKKKSEAAEKQKTDKTVDKGGESKTIEAENILVQEFTQLSTS